MATARTRVRAVWAHPATQPAVVFLGLVIGCVVIWFVLSQIPDPGPCGYFSDACAAQVGGLGIAPGANIGDGYACFEATHGTAPKYADKDVINPGSVILSGVMMLRFLGWNEAADLVEQGLERTIEQKKVTYDFERLMEGATKVKTSEFANYIIENMGAGVLTAAD